jgi:hypothetical protein
VKACSEVEDIFTLPQPYPLGKYSQYHEVREWVDLRFGLDTLRFFSLHDIVTPDLNDEVLWLALIVWLIIRVDNFKLIY